MNKLRPIKYKRYELRSEAEACEGTLLTLIYDIPYFPACGIFPPLHIINQVFSSGGCSGGLGPGASWEPFTISEEEYSVLKEAIRDTPVSEIEPYARYANVRLRFDTEFDHIENQVAWIKAVCKKHRDSWKAELREAGKIA